MIPFHELADIGFAEWVIVGCCWGLPLLIALLIVKRYDKQKKRIPPGWFDDPTKRNERRYWNGKEWTTDVRNGTTFSKDPVIMPGNEDV